MWRAIRNLLPSAENMWKRKVLQEPSCQRCKRNVESIYHALVDCKAAKKIWNHGLLAVPPPNTHLQDVLSFFLEMTNNLRKSELELMVVYCWSVWHSRNKFIFKGQKMEPSLAAAKAESILAAYQRVRKQVPAPTTGAKVEKDQMWTPPPKNTFKINVDAAVSLRDQRAAFGVVIKESRSNTVAVGINQVQFKGNVSWAEAGAVQWGIKVTREA